MVKMINPYDLLGVTIDSSKEEVKKRYYELSLVLHPDKGGSGEDMACLHSAYKFVMMELENINRTVTVEQLETEFKEFCATQEKQVPMFQDIYAEAFDLPKFNEYYDTMADNVATASLKGGYGDLMEKSTLTDNTTTEYKPVETGTLANPFQAITMYKPLEECGTHQAAYDLIHGCSGVDNYSMEVNGVHMTDYKEAFTPQVATLDDVKEPPQKTLEDLVKEREESGYNDESNLKGYTWSFQGFLDSTRKRVFNYLRIK